MNSLSDEVLLHIIRFLTFKDIMSICCVNRRLNQVCKDQSLARNITCNNWSNFNGTILMKFIGICKSLLRVINLENCYWLSSTMLQQSLKKCRNLVKIGLRGCNVTVKGLAAILTSNPMVVNLSWSLPEGSFQTEIFPENLRTSFTKLDALTITVTKWSSDSSIVFLLNSCIGKTLSQLTVYYSSHTPLFSIKIVNGAISFKKPFGELVASYLSSDAFKALWSATTGHITDNMITDVDMHLRQLDVSKGEQYLFSIAKRITELIYFSSKYCKLTDDSLNIICHMNTNLQYLNVQGCGDCLGPDFQGLLSIANNCKKLRHLNISDIHCHTRTTGDKTPLQILSSITTLEALAVSGCMLAQTNRTSLCKKEEAVSSKSSQQLFKTKRVSHLPVTRGSCTISACSEKSHARVAAGSSSENFPGEYEPSMTKFTGWCTKMKEFEMIKQLNDECSWISTDEDLLVVSTWKNLRKLTLCGIKLLGKTNFLLRVAKTCTAVEFLSLRHMDVRLSFGSTTWLTNSLPYFKKLKIFRFEQRYFNITQAFLVSLYECQQLHSLCIISRCGVIRDDALFFQLFATCKQLTVMYISCDTPVLRMKKIRICLIESFLPCRPALSITMSPFQLESSGLHVNHPSKIPDCIKYDLVSFESKVAHFCVYNIE